MKRYRHNTKKEGVFPEKKPFKITEIEINDLLVPLYASDDFVEDSGTEGSAKADAKFRELDAILNGTYKPRASDKLPERSGKWKELDELLKDNDE